MSSVKIPNEWLVKNFCLLLINTHNPLLGKSKELLGIVLPLALQCIMIHILFIELEEFCVSGMIKRLHLDKRSRKMMVYSCLYLITIICNCN